MNSSAPEGLAVHVPHVTPVELLLSDTNNTNVIELGVYKHDLEATLFVYLSRRETEHPMFLSSSGKTPCTILLSLGKLRQHNFKMFLFSQQVNKCSSVLRFDADINTVGRGQIS